MIRFLIGYVVNVLPLVGVEQTDEHFYPLYVR